jgi:hypothetical protein
MGLFLFSLAVSVILAGSLWLIIGDQLPPGDGVKWSARVNITVYTGSLFLVIYLVVFLLDF